MTRRATIAIAAALSGAAGAAAALLAGCEIFPLVGGMAQNFEYQKLIEVHPQYAGLENHKTAVLVSTDYAVLYEHSDIPLTISANVSNTIATKVPGATIVSPAVVLEWQFRTPSWQALTYSEMATVLKAERLVIVDIQEFRLNPPGNQWLWEGACSAQIHVVEAGGIDPDSFADSFGIEVEYPGISGVSREQATSSAIKTGVLAQFCQKTSWLFYQHLEPKYPDKYNGPPPASREAELKEKP